MIKAAPFLSPICPSDYIMKGNDISAIMYILRLIGPNPKLNLH
jgi:hypothetical protein